MVSMSVTMTRCGAEAVSLKYYGMGITESRTLSSSLARNSTNAA
jgi:hypothetical protein